MKVSSFTQVGDLELELVFDDGSRGRVDFGPWLLGRPGLLADLADPAFFAQVALDPESGTLRWPNGVDLCPDVLHHRATGAPLPAGAGPIREEATAGSR